MNNLKSYLLLFIGFLFSIVNLYSQSIRIDNYYLDHLEKLNSNKHKDINHDQRYNEIEYSRILHHMQNQEFESSFVVDSVTSTGYWADKRKYIYSYDAKGNLTSALLEGRDGNQLIIGQSTYDSNNNMISELREWWDENENQLVHSRRYTCTYDSNNNMTSELYEGFEENQLVYMFRYAFSYDTNNNMTSKLFEGFEENKWVLHYRYTWAYDSNNNMVFAFEENFDDNQLLWYSGRSTYTYDSNYNMTFRLGEDWDGNQWVISGRSTYTYDSKNNMISELKEDWDGNQWVLRYRYTWAYDSNNNMISELTEDWDGNQWLLWIRSTYIYDSNNNMTSELEESFHENEFNFGSRNTFIYDSNSNLTFAKFEIRWSSDSSWTPLPDGMGYGWIEFLFNDSFGREFSVQGSEISIYYSVITEVENSNRIISNFSLSQNYPNPFNPNTTIKYSIPSQSNVTLKVYDVLGSEVTTLVNTQQTQGNYEVEFYGSELSSGLYFYRLSAGDFVETKKMILLK